MRRYGGKLDVIGIGRDFGEGEEVVVGDGRRERGIGREEDCREMYG